MVELVSVRADPRHAGTWRFLLDDPPRANALSQSLVAQLGVALRDAFASDARSIVFESSGSSFCAGFDLSDVESLSDTTLRERFAAVEDLLELIRRAPALTIAMVRGAAFGAGADIVASCDYRLGTPSARFAFPGIRFGVVLGTRHLASVVGRQIAREILIEGKTLDAQSALDCGLLSSLGTDDALDARANEVLRDFESIESTTLRSILALTRDTPSTRDHAELIRSIQLDGLAARIREHANRVRGARLARQT